MRLTSKRMTRYVFHNFSNITFLIFVSQADDGKSSLRDLLGTEEEFSPGLPEEREVLRMELPKTEAEFPGAPHRWLCDGTVLRLEDPGHQHNLGLLKVRLNPFTRNCSLSFFPSFSSFPTPPF